MSGERRSGLPAVLAMLGVIVVGNAGGFLLGRRIAESRVAPIAPPAGPPAPATAASFAEEIAQAALVAPVSASVGPLPWQAAELAIAQSFARRGVELDPKLAPNDAVLAANVVRLKELGEPDAIAALLDLWAEVAERARRGGVGAAVTRLARALDPEAKRDSIRAALLDGNSSPVRELAADAEVARLPMRTSALLGLALLHFNLDDDACEVWRSAVVQHPSDAALHIMLGWSLACGDEATPPEARRHLEAARALLAANGSLVQRLKEFVR